MLSPAFKLAAQGLMLSLFAVCPPQRQELHQACLRTMAAFTTSDPDVGSLVMQQLRNHIATTSSLGIGPQAELVLQQHRDACCLMLIDLAKSANRCQQALQQGLLSPSVPPPPQHPASPAAVEPSGSATPSGSLSPFVPAVDNSSGGLSRLWSSPLAPHHAAPQPRVVRGDHGTPLKRASFPSNPQSALSGVADEVPPPRPPTWGGPYARQSSMATTWEEDENNEGEARTAQSSHRYPAWGWQKMQEERLMGSNQGNPSRYSYGSGMPLDSRGEMLSTGSNRTSMDQPAEEAGGGSLLGEAFSTLNINNDGWLGAPTQNRADEPHLPPHHQTGGMPSQYQRQN